MDVLNEIKRLKNIADIGLLYAKDPYDRERYSELFDISLNLLATVTDTPLSKLSDFYLPPTDYPTPKVDVRALVLDEQKHILMARERSDGRWSLPGGWADVGLSPREIAVKEVFEETGLTVEPQHLLAVFDKKCHPHPPQGFYVYKLVILCSYVSGHLQPAHDILDAQFFSIASLPPLSENRILESQVKLVFEKAVSGDLRTYFD
ncbi:MAG: NUDIX hydrolase [Saprospiraceae bacterium]|nr:NUDIX hydrolase [Saprospiraceae bacterium]